MVLHGSVRWDELCGLYRSAHLLLLPSDTEGFPKVVHEAALFGVPAVDRPRKMRILTWLWPARRRASWPIENVQEQADG